jgi:cobalt-zinc-cadmium efflux system protein
MGAHHDHHHNYNHAGHSHTPVDFGKAFAIGIVLNTAFVLVEAGYGFASHSMALLADAGHNLSDVLGLIVAWAASVVAKREPTPRFTYGLRGTTVLAALFNALLLMAAIGAIAWEAIQRILAPQPVASGTMMVVAAIGILINAATAYMFMSGRHHDLNVRGAYLHMLADAGISFGVVVAGALIMVTGFTWLDPLTSLVIAAVIAIGTWGLFRESAVLSVAAVPQHIDADAVRRHLTQEPEVESVHDLHIWAIGTQHVALTAHLVCPAGHPGDDTLRHIAHELSDHFGISHATLQVERNGSGCSLAPDSVI